MREVNEKQKNKWVIDGQITLTKDNEGLHIRFDYGSDPQRIWTISDESLNDPDEDMRSYKILHGFKSLGRIILTKITEEDDDLGTFIRHYYDSNFPNKRTN